MTDLIENTPVLVKKARVRLAKGTCCEHTCTVLLRDAGKKDGSRFCSKACHDRFHNRQKVQGRKLINVAKRWRRYGGKGSFTEVTRLLDALIRDDAVLGIDKYPESPIEATQAIIIKGFRKVA